MLHVERITIPNPLKNYNHLLVCTETNEAMMIDPADASRCIAVAKKNGWKITQLVSTHEHGDHICGNDDVVKACQCPLSAPIEAQASIPRVDHWLKHGDTVQVGNITLNVLDTPGHTMSHICLYHDSDNPVLICGDTLFNAGVGNCYSGDSAVLYESIAKFICDLPDKTRIYPGHDYIENNLEFAAVREPDNTRISELLDEVSQQTPDTRLVTDLGMERKINPFFRLSNPSIKKGLLNDFPEMGSSDKDVFIHLRKLRDVW